MPRLSGGEEGRGKLRKATGSCKQTLIRRYPNGATRQVEDLSPCNTWGERGELKHLSTRRKRKKHRYPEYRRSKGAEPKPVGLRTSRGCRSVQRNMSRNAKRMERRREEGDTPVAATRTCQGRHLSRAGHEESCPNLRGPSRKAKHFRKTDSGPVPLGKGGKHPEQGSEIEPETVRLQAVGARESDGVPFA